MDVPEADCLLIVPPLAHLTWPSLGVHQLQACARARGLEVRILYVNALLAERVGCPRYAALCNAPVRWLLGERLFCRSAYGLPALGHGLDAFFVDVGRTGGGRPATAYTDHLCSPSDPGDPTFTPDELLELEAIATELVEEVATAVRESGIGVVGATTTFDQTAAAVALLGRIRGPTVTLLGGANCDGPMAAGLQEIAGVDHVFQGESEAVFVDVLADLLQGDTAPHVVTGRPCRDLDALPTPEFTDFFDQVPESLDAPLWLLYETSRGCWWGAVRHCTFCGLNPRGMGFRERSPDRVIADLGALTDRTHRVCMTDNIMPHSYHRTLIPQLTETLPGLELFYEQKANLRLEQVHGLVQAGCRSIQPGIESLDSELLGQMKKGLLARQAIALLRYAFVCGLNLRWNLLWGVPGDTLAPYERMVELLPLLHHLQPPQALAHIHLDRFSPYVDEAEAFGISGLTAMPAYADVFPDSADLDRIAYHFEGEVPSASRSDPKGMEPLLEAMSAWQDAWARAEGPPALVARPVGDRWVLHDTRGLGPAVHELDMAQARAVLVGGPMKRVSAAPWAIRARLAVERDGWCVPLAMAPYEALKALEGLPAASRQSEEEQTPQAGRPA